MAEIKLDAEARTEFGKGAARRIRRDNKIPAVLYGHGTDPVHITLPGHATLLALRQANALLDLAMPDGTDQLALPKQVQRNPVTGHIEHVDLVIVRRGEKVTVEVPLVLDGESAPGTLVNQERPTLTVQAEATNIPREIPLSVAGFGVGHQVLAGEVPLPEGVTLAEEADELVVSVTAQISEAALEAELGEGAETVEAASGETTAAAESE